MLFKDTKKKSSSDVTEFAESLGATIDRFITKETSRIYCRYFADNVKDIIDLISENITDSVFNEQLLEKEKNLIINEINVGEDSLQKYFFMLINQALFDNLSKVFPIISSVESTKECSHEAVINYYNNKFLKSLICISVAGKIAHNQLIYKLKLPMHFKGA